MMMVVTMMEVELHLFSKLRNEALVCQIEANWGGSGKETRERSRMT